MDPEFCARCSTSLRPGIDIFYLVTIEAVADPTPPVMSAVDITRDTRKEMAALLGELAELSEQEAMDQVYRRLTLRLCGPCYRGWIEDPAGGEALR
jgi:hypothetical protein